MGQKTGLNHYEVLALSHLLVANQEISQHDIKAAYRDALLHYHPDKFKGAKREMTNAPIYTVDEITQAFKVLGNPRSRSQYDQGLKFPSREIVNAKGSHLGLETVDLDDLRLDEEQKIWYRGCRCGSEQCFIVSEEELEKNAEVGEVIIGCQGCSLWLRVTFVVSEDQ